jgi:hypothetical protein
VRAGVVVHISATIFKHNAFNHYVVSVQLTKLLMNFNWSVDFHQQKPNHQTHLTGFSIAAHTLKIQGEQNRSSTNCMLPQLDA